MKDITLGVLALAGLLMIPGLMLLGEVRIFRGRRIHWWRSYAYHFPEASNGPKVVSAGPAAADLGEISLKHIWYYVRIQNFDFFLPWRASWLVAELGMEGLLLRNAPSLFKGVNALGSLWIPRDRLLWASVAPEGWMRDAEVCLELKGTFEPGKDPDFSIPLQVSCRLYLPTPTARQWRETLEGMGVPVTGREAAP